jgi:hypothetical protein
LPPELRTIALPPFGSHVGVSSSKPIATPPPLAVAVTNPPGVLQLASASPPSVAFAFALQAESAWAAALLPLDALACADPVAPVQSASERLSVLAVDFALHAADAKASAALAPLELAVAVPPLLVHALASLPVFAFANALWPDVFAFASQLFPSVSESEISPDVETQVTPEAEFAIAGAHTSKSPLRSPHRPA